MSSLNALYIHIHTYIASYLCISYISWHPNGTMHVIDIQLDNCSCTVIATYIAICMYNISMIRIYWRNYITHVCIYIHPLVSYVHNICNKYSLSLLIKFKSGDGYMKKWWRVQNNLKNVAICDKSEDSNQSRYLNVIVYKFECEI